MWNLELLSLKTLWLDQIPEDKLFIDQKQRVRISEVRKTPAFAGILRHLDQVIGIGWQVFRYSKHIS